MKKKVNANAIRQKAAKKMYVPQEIESSISGVTRPMILILGINIYLANDNMRTYKLHIQVAEVVIEIAFDRMERLKISDGRTHPMGAFESR